MEFITWLISFIMHIDRHLVDIIQQYGTLTYFIIFLIIFCETGLVVTPFLPGDSLIFALGALAAGGDAGLGFDKRGFGGCGNTWRYGQLSYR